MRAAMFYGPNQVEYIEIDKPNPDTGQLLIKVKYCGICGSDYLIYNGKYHAAFPVVLGHEYAGEVIEIGSGVDEFKVGDRVTVDPNIYCGKCFWCRRGEAHLCENLTPLGITYNGGFAEYSWVPVSNAYKLTDKVSYEDGALVEPLACCLRGIEMAQVKPGDIVVVLGTGGIGNMMIRLLRIYGASIIIASETQASRRKLASISGADLVLDPQNDDVEEEIRKISPQGADIVFECAGSVTTQERSLYMARRGGTIIFFGCSSEDQRISVSPFIVNENELTVRGSFNNPYTHPAAVSLVNSNRIKLSDIVSHKYPLSGITRAFNDFNNRDVVKILIEPDII